MWDLGVFGLGEKRAIDFTQLHQRWLRERRRATRSSGSLEPRDEDRAPGRASGFGHLSDYLDRREDRGEQPSALTREDMTGFLSWLRGRVPARTGGT